MRITGYIMAIATIATGGCTIFDGRPAVATLEPPAQVKLKSAAHWQIVANDIGSQINANITSKNLGNQAIRVPVDSTSSKFAKVFASQLQSSLLQSGMKVVDGKENALEVSVTTEEVWHGPYRHVYRPGSITALTGGVLVLRDAFLNSATPINAVIGAAIGLDAAKTIEEFSGRPFTEIVLTTSVKQGNTFVMHRTDVYYVDEVDVSLFDSGQRQFRIVGVK